jgi:hypothetical protein
VGQTGAKVKDLYLRNRNPQGIAKNPLGKFSTWTRTSRWRWNQHHKESSHHGWPVCCYLWIMTVQH